ncbi:WD40 repeat domain-containing protein [Kineosporia sp. A_224]|uniref:WD40 repeat domain-containing protein n=1 Tax=Kineosporia sp. A_224 TaxID=1962180 RepID=UPI000B4B2D0A|nr:WD40 repeat domain-containing protein [Kineosporia sp. A_224]
MASSDVSTGEEQQDDGRSDDRPEGRAPATGPSDAREQMRSGLRRHVGRLGAGAVTGLRRSAPNGVVAVLVAAALAPVAGAAVGGAATAGLLAAVLAQVGQVGAGYLVEAVLEARRRLADRSGRADRVMDEDAFVDVLAAELEERLGADDGAATALRGEMSGLLRAVDAVPALLGDRLDRVDDVLDATRAAVAQSLLAVARGHEEFGWLVTGVDDRVRAVQEQLSRMEAADRQRAATAGQTLVGLAMLRQEVERLRHSVADGGADGGTDGPPRPGPSTGPPGDPAGGAPPAPGESPYPGLAAFRTRDARWFRGRDRLVATLVTRLATGPAPVVVLGPSGAGKSSLLAAGLLPALAAGALPEEGSADRPHLVLTPGAHPVDTLAACVAVLTGTDAGALAAGLRTDPLRLRASLLQAAASVHPEGAAAVTGPGRRTGAVLVVDQLEELFTMCPDEAERQAFLDALAAVSDGPALVVLGVRSDFYTDCTRYPLLRDALAAGGVLVGPMSDDELRSAVAGPAADGGWELEPGLLDVLLADLGTGPRTPYPPGALPLLAHALRGTWRRRSGRVLTLAGYRATGGLDGAVAATAEAVHAGLDDEGRTALRHLATALVDDGGAGERTRRRLPVDDALRFAGGGPAARLVLDRLVAARLVTTTTPDDGTGASGATVELTHEAVVGAWPRLRDWLDEDAGARRERRSLEAAAAEWQRVGRDDGALLRGARLAAAQAWFDDPLRRARLTRAEDDLVAASLAARDAAGRTARRRARRLAVLAGALAVLTVVSGGATVSALRSRATAQTQRTDAVSRQLAAEALAARGTEPQRAKLLALAAWRTAPTAEARGALLSLQAQPYAGQVATGTKDLRAIAVSPDGRTLASVGGEGRVELRPVDGDGAVRALDGVVGNARGVAFTSDGRFVVAGGIRGDGTGATLFWWDAATGSPAGTLAPVGVSSLAVGPDPDLVAVGTGAGGSPVVQVWSLSRRRAVATTPPAGDFVWGLAWSPDGTTLAGGTGVGRVLLWDADAGRRLATLGAHTGQATAVAWAPDGDTLYSTGQDGRVRRWDVPARREVSGGALTVVGSPSTAYYATVAVSPDGSRVVAGGSSSAVDRWSARDGANLTSWAVAPVLVTAMAWTPDGRILLDGTSDGTVTRWAAQDQVDGWFTGAVLGADLSPRGDLVAAVGVEGVIRIRAVDGGRLVRSIRSAPATSVAFTADGRSLVVAHGDGRLRVWDVRSGRETRSVDVNAGGGAPRNPVDVALSPDGRSVAATTTPRQITVEDTEEPGRASVVVRWDLTTGRLAPDLADPRRRVTGVAWTSDGRHLVTGLDGAGLGTTAGPEQDVLRVYDATTGAVVSEAPTRPLTGVYASGDGRTIGVAGADGSVQSFTVSPDGAVVRPGPVHVVTPGWPLRTARLSPDGRTLAVTSATDLRVRLLETASGRETAALTFHTDRLERVAFSADGRRLVTTSDDARAVTWSLDPADVVRDLCADVAGPSLAADWRQVVGSGRLGATPCG